MKNLHGRSNEAEAALARLASVQHGVFTRLQALVSGFTARMIELRVGQGRWISVGYGVYRQSTTPPTWSLVVMAACLAGPAVASHRAAARLWMFPGFDAAAPELTIYRHRRPSTGRVVWHESWFLHETRDTTMLDRIPATSATRTIVDLSAVASAEAIEIALDNARHRGLTDAARVEAEVDRMHRPFGTTRIREVLALKSPADAAAESPLETRVAILLRSTDLPKPTPQYVVRDKGAFVARVDFAWPDRFVALEVDGFRFHAHRAAWDRDQERTSKLAACGWRVLRITHTRLAHPAGFIDDLRKSLVRFPPTE